MRFGSIRRRARAGFTFVEVLAALMFLSIAVPAIISALTVANRASVVAERGALAGELAENKLNEMLLDDAWESPADTRGVCGDQWPGFRWEMTTQTWTGETTGATTGGNTSGLTSGSGSGVSGALTELSVEVFYPVQGSERSVRLTTLVSPLSTTTSATTGTTTR